MPISDRESKRSARAKLFRGSEFPRLLVLLAVVAVGWPLVALSRKRADRRPARKPATLAAQTPPLPKPDRSKVFAAVQDKAPLNWRENAAYAALLTRARETKPESLAAESRTDVYYSDLVSRPGRHRGIPIHIEGTARRVRVDDEIAKELTPKSRLYEAYVFTSESRNYPYILVFENAPKDLVAGADVFEKIVFDGYFFKLLLYRDGNRDLRFAPMLVGRIAVRKSLEQIEAAEADSSFWGRIPWRAVGFAAVVGYLLIRLLGFSRKLFFPTRAPISRKGLPNDEIQPHALADWLADDAPAFEKQPDGRNGSHPAYDPDDSPRA